MLLAKSENDALTDGRTDVLSDRWTLERNFLNGGYNIMPAFLKWWGIKTMKLYTGAWINVHLIFSVTHVKQGLAMEYTSYNYLNEIHDI